MKKRKKKVGNWQDKNNDIKKNRNYFFNTMDNHFLKQYLLNTVRIEEHKEPWKNFFH